MKLVVGLGNPGPRYETTRHNVGWLALDRLIDRWGAAPAGRKFESELWSTNVRGEKALLVKPQTFMNLSGKAVGPLFGFQKCRPTDVVVLHDELDLPPLAFRLKTGGGTGGHNGLKSLDQHLGSANKGYHRVRIGVGHPRALGLPLDPADYVLQPFSDSELQKLDPLLDEIAEAVELLLAGEATRAMNRFNRAQ
jgi:PTH1 family peptidyl-tRNA hydrolase